MLAIITKMTLTQVTHAPILSLFSCAGRRERLGHRARETESHRYRGGGHGIDAENIFYVFLKY